MSSKSCRGLGLGVSIDDFGSGFTSLAYLGSLPITELKLDRSFISGLSASGREQDIKLVRATIELGHALGLLVVAEGIETLAMLELLALLGCDRAQGYFTGRPVPALEFEAGATHPTLRVAPANPVAGCRNLPTHRRLIRGRRSATRVHLDSCDSCAAYRPTASDLCAAAEEPQALL